MLLSLPSCSMCTKHALCVKEKLNVIPVWHNLPFMGQALLLEKAAGEIETIVLCNVQGHGCKTYFNQLLRQSVQTNPAPEASH